MTKPKPKWRTLRCVVEYRTADPNLSERDLARRVQGAINHYLEMPDSKPWAKPFNAVLALMKGARPKKLLTVSRQLEAVAARLRKL